MADYISREAAIAYIRELAEESQKAFEELGGESGIYADAYNELAEDFRKIHAADVEPVRRWIPCSERLPGLPIDVLAVVSGTVGNIRLVDSLEIGSFHVEEGWILEMWPEWEDPTVTHWMPLPKPPLKGGTEDG